MKQVRLTKVFKTDINTMFDLWTQPEHLKSWHRPHNTLFSTPDAAVELRVGGHYKIVMEGPEGRHTVAAEFTEIDRPNSLGLKWQWENGTEVTNLKLAFRSVPDGTELTLIHEHPDSSTMMESHKQGWEGCLAVLETLVNNKEKA